VIEIVEACERLQAKVDRMNQNQVGWVVVASAIGLMAMNVADSIADLQNWHAASTPAFVAVVLKQLGSTELAALGGKMTTQFGKSGS